MPMTAPTVRTRETRAIDKAHWFPRECDEEEEGWVEEVEELALDARFDWLTKIGPF